MLAFGEVYMAQIVRNARALAAALDSRGVSGFWASPRVIRARTK